MSRFLLTLFLTLFVSLGVFAQDYKVLLEAAKSEKQYQKKINLLSKALNLAEKQKDTVALIEIYDELISISEFYSKKYFFQKQNLLLKNYLKTHPSKKYYVKLFSNYERLALISEKNSEIYLAKDYYRKMLEISDLIKSDSLLAKTYLRIGSLHYFMRDIDSAENYFLKALRIFREIKDTFNIIISYEYLANLYSFTNNFDSAVYAVINSLELAKIINNDYLLASAYLNFAKIYFKLNIIDSAFWYVQKSINTSSALNSVELLISQKIFLGKIYAKKGNCKKAIRNFLDVYQLTDKEVYPTYLILELLYLGKCYTETENYDSAKIYLIQASLIVQKLKFYQSFAAKVYYDFAFYFYRIKNLSKAEFYLLKSIEFAQLYEDNEVLLDAYKLLSKLYEEKRQYDKALTLYKEYVDLYDSLYNRNFLQELILTKQKEIYRKRLTKYNRALEKKNKFSTTLMVFLLAMIFLLLIILLLYINSRKKNRLLSIQKKRIETLYSIIKKQTIHYKFLSLVANHTQNSVFILGSDGTIIWVNPAFEKLYGMTLKDFKKKFGDNFYKVTRYKNPDEIYQKCIVQRQSFEYINKHIINGKIVWIKTIISPVVENDRVTNLIGVETDITKLKLAEERIERQKKELENKNKLLELYNKELKEKQEAIVKQNEELKQQQEELKMQTQLLKKYNEELSRLSVVATYTDNSIAIFSPEGEIQWVNPAFVRNTGYTLEEFIETFGKNILQSSSFKYIEEYFYKALYEKISVQYISQFKTKYGKVLWLQTTLTPILDANKEVTSLVTIDSDITEIKEAERKIYQQNREIISSLEYARRILKALEPLPLFLDILFKEYFIFNRPKDIVSGDFYFVSYRDDKILVALADCTGHGIPGAFMSIVGNMVFNNVVAKEVFKPDRILEALRINMIRILHQRGKEGEAFDSMDVGLVIFDTNTNKLEYAGANIPLYITKKNADNAVEVRRINPTKTTIGFVEEEKPFNVHIVNITEDVYVYMSSDGYTDQLGGENQKKFKRKRFIELLRKIYGLPMSKQREIIEQTHEEWKGNHEQVDDILVLGIKFL